MINELVQKLSEGNHEVVIGYRSESYEDIKTRLQDGYMHIKFTQTRGGTELGINVDADTVNLEDVDFINGNGLLHIEGTINLNYNEVRCIADVDLKTRKGQGHLKIIQQEEKI